MRGRGLLMALLFVVAVVALAWLTGDNGPWGNNATNDASAKDQP